MQFRRSIEYIFEHKDWVSNVLMILICALIPVLGQLILFGYMFELIDFWRTHPNVKDYPKFDFNRFSPYLKRGVWPFVVNLVIGMVTSLPITFCAIGVQLLGVFAAREEPVLMVPVMLLFLCIILVGIVLATVLVWPAILFAGLRQGLDISGMVAFLKDFLRRVGKETVFSIVFLCVAGTVIGLVGTCLFLIGAFFGGIILTMAYHHLSYQLYDLYLQRGGSEVLPDAGAHSPRAVFNSDAAGASPEDRPA